MDNEKEKKTEPAPEKIKLQVRQVIIETDGNTVKIIKAEVPGLIELKGVLELCLKAIEGQPRSN